MIGKITKVTAKKLLGTWAWQCRKCFKEYSYAIKKCKCEGMKDRNCVYFLTCKMDDCNNCDSYEPIVNEEEFHRCEDYK